MMNLRFTEFDLDTAKNKKTFYGVDLIPDVDTECAFVMIHEDSGKWRVRMIFKQDLERFLNEYEVVTERINIPSFKRKL